jgi:hypothetical protein
MMLAPGTYRASTDEEYLENPLSIAEQVAVHHTIGFWIPDDQSDADEQRVADTKRDPR